MPHIPEHDPNKEPKRNKIQYRGVELLIGWYAVGVEDFLRDL